jgi:hypothetical protein
MDELQPLARLEGEIGNAAPELVGRVLLRQETENTVDLNWRTQPKPLATMPQTRITLLVPSAVIEGQIPQKLRSSNPCRPISARKICITGTLEGRGINPTRGPTKVWRSTRRCPSHPKVLQGKRRIGKYFSTGMTVRAYTTRVSDRRG